MGRGDIKRSECKMNEGNHSDKDGNREDKKRRKHEDDDDLHRKHKHRKKGKDKGRHKDRTSEHSLEVVEDPKDDIWREKDLTKDGEKVRLI
jgi:hypothetical protein